MTSIAEIRELVRAKRYVVSHHAADELEDDDLTILDLESIIFNGELSHRQRDRRTGEPKLVVSGECLQGRKAEVVVKVGFRGVLIVITVYLA